MTRRTDPANHASCALVLDLIVERVRANPLVTIAMRSNAELGHAMAAAQAALAGVQLERVKCSRCGWVGAFPVRRPTSFGCCKCASTMGEALP